MSLPIFRVAFFGDAFMDVQTSPMTSLPNWDEDRIVNSVQLAPGGSVVNAARHFSSLVPNTIGTAHLCVTVGDDALGTIMLSTIEKDGNLDTQNIVVAKNTSMSTCLVLVGPNGKRAFVSTRSTSNDLTNAELVANSGLLNPANEGGANHVHVSGLFSTLGLQTENFLQVMKTAKKDSNFTFSLDTQYDATGKWVGTENIILDLIQLCDLFVPNHIELCGIASAYRNDSDNKEPCNDTEIALRWLMEAAPNTLIVVKAGPDGAIVAKSGYEIVRVAAPTLKKGECLDTCGAGDCFSAALLSKLLPQLCRENDTNRNEGKMIELNVLQPTSDILLEAVSYGCKGGTWCCQQVGACIKTVKREDLH
jgi:sugar/nucleoside kinase (ribokinase family)